MLEVMDTDPAVKDESAGPKGPALRTEPGYVGRVLSDPARRV